MANLQILGPRRPSGLAYVISEGILPPDPPPSSYVLQTFSDSSQTDVSIDEEILVAGTCVVWSRGVSIQKAFRFDVEKEDITFTTLTNLSANNDCPASITGLDPPEPVRSLPVPFRSISGRSLVVVLQTQIRIFILNGASYVLPLPFDVASIYPIRGGMILERKTLKTPSKTLPQVIPSVPKNSFVVPPFGSSYSQLLRSTSDGSVNGETASTDPFVSLFATVRGQGVANSDDRGPRYYCLTEPFEGLTALGCSKLPKYPSKEQQRELADATKALPMGEDVVYVSAGDELKVNMVQQRKPVEIAVTVNQKHERITIWHVEHVVEDVILLRGSGAPQALKVSTVKRRSSYGPGTGTTTPAARTSMSVRESFGGLRPDRRVVDDAELAAELDPAFENPGAPAKSSRRISSLMARSELSHSNEASSFTEYPTKHGSVNRNTSFGRRKTRSSQINYAQSARSLRSDRDSLGTRSLAGSSMGDSSDSSESDDGTITIDRIGTNKSQAFSDRVVFRKIYSMHMASSGIEAHKSSNERQRYSSFTCPVDGSTTNNASEFVAIILDHSSRRLYMIKMLLRNDGEVGTSLPRVTASDTRYLTGVVDACRVSHEDKNAVLVLSEGGDKQIHTVLHSPWSELVEIPLMNSLAILGKRSIPHRVITPRQRPMPGAFESNFRPCGFRAHLRNGMVDLVDENQAILSVKLHLSPRNKLVRTLLSICDGVLRNRKSSSDSLYLRWLRVMTWLKGEPERGTDSDWTGFVVALFSSCLPIVDIRPNQAVVRAKRRKTGLLRSGSGAQSNLESWESMLDHEMGSFSTKPAWLVKNSWDWITTSLKLPTPQSSPKSRKPVVSRDYVAELETTLSRQNTFLVDCVRNATAFLQSSPALDRVFHKPSHTWSNFSSLEVGKVMLVIHIYREMLKLSVLEARNVDLLLPVLAQIGGWLNWDGWSYGESSQYTAESAALQDWSFVAGKIAVDAGDAPSKDLSIMLHLEQLYQTFSEDRFPSLQDIADIGGPQPSKRKDELVTVPIAAGITQLLQSSTLRTTQELVTAASSFFITRSLLETVPDGAAAFLKSGLAVSQADPPYKPSITVLEMIGRGDIGLMQQAPGHKPRQKLLASFVGTSTRDVHAICHSTLEVDSLGPHETKFEADRALVTRMIFKDDQRFAEASKLVQPTRPVVVKCIPEPEWSDAEVLEAQQELARIVAVRTLSVSSGRAMIYYNARRPLLTERFPFHGFNLNCVVKPSDTTVSVDKNMYTEERVSWAFFHCGVELGLSIAKSAKGVDTSWILFNKPPTDLGNRHAGFLLALGLNGHLKNIAKWVAFKYLTPKHTMTSVGLLLGLAASYLGTMDTLITRLLSVHVTRMLPPGAAELNLSPLTQTTGIFAIGLLYCNTQHRRMSEIMLSEMENTDIDDNVNPMENLRDESYRLSAGFALGYINLAQGKNLRGLHDMRIVERLLSLAVGTKQVDVVHILDKATAAATMALALIFMKTEDATLARKIDIPDTTHQFEYVRPDIFLLRTLAKHLIMWNEITPSMAWINSQLPEALQPRSRLNTIRTLRTHDMPLFNIIAGICMSIGLRFAGSALQDVRKLLCHFLDQFIRIVRLPAVNYDSKLARITARNCQDAIALAAACVMAGTGDIYLFRRLRALHGRTDAETPYGSHLAAHQAIGVLFLGGGTHTFSTTPLAIASLLVSFYPLLPASIQDNKSHLQALRHLWVLATEPRCLVVRDADTHRPIALKMIIVLKNGDELDANAPCLLPELDTIARIHTDDAQFWRITLEFAENPAHLQAFTTNQSIYVRRRTAYNTMSNPFSATVQALNDAAIARQVVDNPLEWILQLPRFATFDRAEKALVLPRANEASTIRDAQRTTIVDDRLALDLAVRSNSAQKLWSLRLLFSWAQAQRAQGKQIAWLGYDVIDELRAAIQLRGRDERSKQYN